MIENPTAILSTLDEERARADYLAQKARGLALNMARGKPSDVQLDLCNDLFSCLSPTDHTAQDGTDCRNYGNLTGLQEAKTLMGTLLEEEDPDCIFIGGTSSLTLEYDTLQRFMQFGTQGQPAWNCQMAHAKESLKWICLVPGYDRHFAITELFGFTLIPVALKPDGPDINVVESLVKDPSVKGMWCVPQYSNPGGEIYGDEVVRRLGAMECGAPDFKIFWDNAYCVHHLYDDDATAVPKKVADIGAACRAGGHPNRYIKFASTSKITVAGGGISAMALSKEMMAEAKKILTVQMIGHDKMNQLRHVRFLKDKEGIDALMKQHAEILRPKFQLVQTKLEQGLGDLGSAGLVSWTNPQGGYFVLFTGAPHTAKRIVALAKEAGVAMTDAGATWPYHQDPEDREIRIAPSMPSLEELDTALDVFIACVKLSLAERVHKG